MKIFVLLLSLVAVPVYAQTPPIDDCPSGHVLHPSLTPTDRAYLTAAATASYIGTHNGQQPCNVRGCGDGDIANWVDGTDHYGLYGDDVCRAGWNLYRERQIGRISTGPADADKPAQFQPSAAPVPPPIPPQPPPVPAPTCDLSGIEGQLVALAAKVDAHDTKADQFQSDVRHWRSDILTFLGKYGAIIGGTIYGTCKAAGSC